LFLNLISTHIWNQEITNIKVTTYLIVIQINFN
jgi:hypothetical protein